MSDMSESKEKTKSEIRAEKQESRNAQRKEKAARFAELQSEQVEEVEELAEENGIDDFVILKSDSGVLACKKASLGEMERFEKVIRGTDIRRGKRKGATDKEATQALVRSARIYPDEEAFEAIIKEQPFLFDAMGEKLVDLAGAGCEAEILKN